MRLGKWEYNNFYSMSNDTMSYNLCIYDSDMKIHQDTLSFFKYMLELESGSILTERQAYEEVLSSYSFPVATIIIEKPAFQESLLCKVEPIPKEIIIRTKNIFCVDNIKDVSKSIKCSDCETIYSAIFRANLELRQAGFDIELTSGLDEDYKI